MKNKPKKFASPEVAAVFEASPPDIRTKLLLLRQLIFDVASQTAGMGELEETLKWGQLNYVTTQSKSGSIIRIDRVKSQAGWYAMYFHCQTTLVDTFKEIYRDKFKYEGNRGITFNVDHEIPEQELRHCISLALTYYLDKKPRQRR